MREKVEKMRGWRINKFHLSSLTRGRGGWGQERERLNILFSADEHVGESIIWKPLTGNSHHCSCFIHLTHLQTVCFNHHTHTGKHSWLHNIPLLVPNPLQHVHQMMEKNLAFIQTCTFAILSAWTAVLEWCSPDLLHPTLPSTQNRCAKYSCCNLDVN